MSNDENIIEFDDQVNGYLVKFKCPSCGRKYKLTLERPVNKNVKCNFCKYLVKIRVHQNAISVS